MKSATIALTTALASAVGGATCAPAVPNDAGVSVDAGHPPPPGAVSICAGSTDEDAIQGFVPDSSGLAERAALSGTYRHEIFGLEDLELFNIAECRAPPSSGFRLQTATGEWTFGITAEDGVRGDVSGDFSATSGDQIAVSFLRNSTSEDLQLVIRDDVAGPLFAIGAGRTSSLLGEVDEQLRVTLGAVSGPEVQDSCGTVKSAAITFESNTSVSVTSGTIGEFQWTGRAAVGRNLGSFGRANTDCSSPFVLYQWMVTISDE